MIKKSLFLFFLVFLQHLLYAQETGGIQMADQMRSNGKIYVVVAVVLTIFAGIILYLVRLDRKISRLEKEKQNQPFISK